MAYSLFNSGPYTPQQDTVQQMRNRPSEQWSSILSGLTRGIGQLDQSAQVQLNELSKQTESLVTSRERLRPEEFENAMGSLHQKAVKYPWDHHIKPKGSNPGDIIEEDGMRKIRTPEGHLQPIAYTTEFMKQNAVPIGESGQVAIPVSPSQPWKVVKAKDRDLAGESQMVDSAEKGIDDIYKKMVEQLNKSPDRLVDIEGKQIPIPLSSDEKRRLSITAADAYLKRKLQAKNVAKQLSDAGTDQLQRGIGGDVPDPFKAEERQRQELEQRVLGRLARGDAARELKNELGGQDVMPGSAGDDVVAPPQPRQASAEESITALMGSEETDEQKAIKKATVRPHEAFQDRLVEAGMMQKPLAAVSKNDMNSTYQSAPEGVVVELPDGRRYIKDGGKFWGIPWSRKQLESDVMLDAAGEAIIDPSTGEAAGGIVAQLEEVSKAKPPKTSLDVFVLDDEGNPIINPTTGEAKTKRVNDQSLDQDIIPHRFTAELLENQPRPDSIRQPEPTPPAMPTIKTTRDEAPKEAETSAPIKTLEYSAADATKSLREIYKNTETRKQIRLAKVVPPNVAIESLPKGIPFRHPKNGNIIIVQEDGTAVVYKRSDLAAVERDFSVGQKKPYAPSGRRIIPPP